MGEDVTVTFEGITKSCPLTSRQIVEAFINSNLSYAKVNIENGATYYLKLRMFLQRNPQLGVRLIKRKKELYLFRDI